MGVLSQLVGQKPAQYVIVPFYDATLKSEARDFWEKAGIWRTSRDELADDIKFPERTVLYVLAHSGRNVSHIASGNGEEMDAGQLVRYLVDANLPNRILCVKIWACFTGVNGFAQEVKAQFLAENKGYAPIVVGYNEVTGGPKDTPDLNHKHVFQLTPGGQRGALIGRASAHRSSF